MITHPTLRMGMETGHLAGFSQGFEKILPIHIIQGSRVRANRRTE
jgi:hypothetical protein